MTMNITNTTLSRRAFLGMAVVAGAVTLLPAIGHAASLKDLLASGAVGERWDGFVQSRDGSGQDVVNNVNNKRMGVYQQRAAETGTSVTDVGRIYAKELYDKAPGGTWFLLENGSWVQK
jgi:uncharacterized protein